MTAPHQPDTEREAFEAWVEREGIPGSISAMWVGFKAARTAAQAQIARLEAERDERERKWKALLAQEHALSDSYVRVRLIVDAMNPPDLTDASTLFAYVEQAAANMRIELAEARATVARMRDALKEERRVRLLGREPDVHWESMRDIRRACYAETDAALSATAKPQEGA